MTIELFDFIGLDALTFLHWMFAISISLFILDFFINTEIITWISLLLFSIYFTLLIEIKMSVPIQWSFIIFVFFLILSFVYYSFIWLKILSPAIKKSLLQNAAVEQQDRAVGDVAVFRIIDGNYFIEWDGELWGAVSNSEKLSNFDDLEKIFIEKSELGKFFINKHPN